MCKRLASHPHPQQQPRRHQNAAYVIELIRERLRQLRQAERSAWPNRLKSLTPAIKRFRKLQRQLKLCHNYVLPSARDQLLAHQLPMLLGEIQREIIPLESLLEQEQQHVIEIPSSRELHGELEQLASEFGRWEFDRHNGALCVVTEAIELEDVFLGPFEIQLLLDRIEPNNRLPLKAIAQNPHPATQDAAVTHPHVHQGNPCLGDATMPAQTALRAGRICDVFLMVQQTLKTYNPESPFVRLEKWFGEPCEECGDDVDEYNRSTCNHCDAILCRTCAQTCHCCKASYCRGCLHECNECDQFVCQYCLTPGSQVCRNCTSKKENKDEAQPAQAAA